MKSKSPILVIENYQFFLKSNYLFESWWIKFLYFIKVRLFRAYCKDVTREFLFLLPIREDFIEWLKKLDSMKIAIHLGKQFPEELKVMLLDKFSFLKKHAVKGESQHLFFLKGSIDHPLIFKNEGKKQEQVSDDKKPPFPMFIGYQSRVFLKVKSFIKAIRCQQYIKNILILVPLVASHNIFDMDKLSMALIAFFAFSFSASTIYVMNDLFDLFDDRKHPTKKNRPLASGDISIQTSLFTIPVLLCLSIFLASLVSNQFVILVFGYLLLNLLYTLFFKRIPIFDIILLSNMYTYRLIIGSEATDIQLSFWLLGFSFFLFLSLAVIKRYKELFYLREQTSSTKSENSRGYRIVDMSILLNMGMTSGAIAVLVFSLYINSPDIQLLYTHPEYLWVACPFMLLWIASLWLATVRNEMSDDPIIYALTNKKSLFLIAICGLILMQAT